MRDELRNETLFRSPPAVHEAWRAEFNKTRPDKTHAVKVCT